MTMQFECRPLLRRVVGALFLGLLLAGCGGGAGNPSAVPAVPVAAGTQDFSLTPAPLIVEVDPFISEVASGNSQLVVLAARSALEVNPFVPLNGAHEVDVDEWSAFSLSAQGFSDLAGWVQRFGAVGISNTSHVVVYDDGEMKFAARIRFLLAHFGVPDPVMLDGGSAALQLRPDLPAIPAASASPAPFRPTINEVPTRLVFKQDVADVLGQSGVQIVDVRSPAEFDGSLLLPGDARPGHIPGAINLPVAQLFDAATPPLILSPPLLAATFVAAKLDPNLRTIAYCHDGAKSSLAAACMVMAGFKNVQLYYDSYENWSQDLTLPVQL